MAVFMLLGGIWLGLHASACSASDSSTDASGGADAAAGSGGTAGTGGNSATGGVTASGGCMASGGATTWDGGPNPFSGINLLTSLSGGCLPARLPTSSVDGAAACRILFAGLAGGCGQAGLSTASAADTSAMESTITSHGGTVPAGPVCQLVQVSAACEPNTGCADSDPKAWCFVVGGCASSSTCSYALCLTDAYVAAPFQPQYTAMACD